MTVVSFTAVGWLPILWLNRLPPSAMPLFPVRRGVIATKAPAISPEMISLGYQALQQPAPTSMFAGAFSAKILPDPSQPSMASKGTYESIIHDTTAFRSVQ